MSLALVFAMALAGAFASGCVIRARARPTYAPPPPRAVHVEYRPGYVWIDGHWAWRYGDWHWEPGYWVRERPGYYYSSGYWDNRGGSYVWVRGSWSRGRSRRRSVQVRDHRGYQPPKRDNRSRGPGGVWTRDQRRQPSRTGGGRDVRSRDHRTQPPRDTRSGGKRGPGNVWGKPKKSKPPKKSYDKPKKGVRKRDHRD